MADGGQSSKPGMLRNIVDFLGDLQGMLQLGRDAGILKKKEEAAITQTLDGEIGAWIRQKMEYEVQLQRLKDKYYGKGIGRTIGAAIGRKLGLAKKEEHLKNIQRLEKLIKNLQKNIDRAIMIDQKMTAEDDALRQEAVEDTRAARARANAADRRTDETHTDQLEQARINRTQAAEKHQRELLEKDIELKKRNVEFEKMKRELDPPASGSLEEAQRNVKLKEAEVELKKKQKELDELTATPAADPLDAQKKEIEKAKIEQELKKEQIALLELQQREAELTKPTAPDPHADVKRQTEEAKLKAELADAQMKELEAEKRKRELTTPAAPDPHKKLREEIEKEELEVKKAEVEARKKHAQSLTQPKKELSPAEISAINRQIGLLEKQIMGLQQERTNITRDARYLKDKPSVDRVRAIDKEIKMLIKQMDDKVKDLSGNP